MGVSEASITAAAAARGITVRPIEPAGWLVFHAARPKSHHAVAETLPALQHLLARMGVRTNPCATYSGNLQQWIHANPDATPDQIEQQAKRLARQAGICPMRHAPIRTPMHNPPQDMRPAPPPSVETLRVPPHSTEAEQSVLGALLTDNAPWAKIQSIVELDDFFRHEHRLIFGAIATTMAAGQPADPLTVYEQLQATGHGQDVGGLKYLTELSLSVAGTANVARYAQIVRERAILRRIVATADSLATRAFRHDEAAGLLDAAKVELAKIAEQSTGSNRPPILDLQQLAEASAGLRWLVKGVVPADSVGMVFGASGTFKSFIALDLALHVAHGLTWLGRRTTQGPVLYIAAEGGSGLHKRVQAWHTQRRIRTTAQAPFFVLPMALDLADGAWRVAEAAEALGVRPALVIIDTLSQTYSGEENSANEVAAYMRELGVRFRAKWGAAVAVIHHSGHLATERPRGSSAMRANLDWMFGVFRDEQEQIATVTCAKQKDAEGFADVTFSMIKQDLGTDADGDPITSLVARHLSSAEEVRDAVQAEAKAGRSNTKRLLMSLVSNGMQEKDLRKAFYEDCGLEAGDAQRQAYHRAKAWAIKAALIDVAQGTVISLKQG